MANFTFIPTSGTVSALITATEVSLPRNANYSSASPQTTQGMVTLVIDRSTLVTGDSYTLNTYEKAGPGATQRTLLDPITIIPGASLYMVRLGLLGDGWDATLKLATGSAKTLTWSIRIDTNDVNALTVSSAAITLIQTGLATATAVASVQTDTTTLTGRLTAPRATNLDNLDAAVTTRAPAATALSSAVYTPTRGANLDNLDATVTSRAAAATALSTAQWTNTRAGLQDNLDTTVSSRAPSATAVSNVDLTPTRAAKLDQLDVATSTRAAAATALSTAQWTNPRAALIDNLDVASSTRAPAATALSSAVYTPTRAANLDNLDVLASSRASATALTAVNVNVTSVGTAVSAVGSAVSAVGTAVVAVNADTDDIQSRLPATLDGGLMRSAVETVGSAALTAIAGAILDFVLDASAPTGAQTLAQRLRLGLGLLVNKVTGLAITTAGTEHVRDGGDTRDIAVYTLATNGTRTPTALDGD